MKNNDFRPSKTRNLETYHPTPAHGIFAEVVLPLAVPKPYTYAVPEDLVAAVRPGLRVEVEFGGAKRYAGLVNRLHNDMPPHKFKTILSSTRSRFSTSAPSSSGNG